MKNDEFGAVQGYQIFFKKDLENFVAIQIKKNYGCTPMPFCRNKFLKTGVRNVVVRLFEYLERILLKNIFLGARKLIIYIVITFPVETICVLLQKV